MKRWIGFCLILFLLSPSALAQRSPREKGLPRLKQDLAIIIEKLLACYERGREVRFLEMAIHLGEIKTHPLFELEWGKRPLNAAAEQELLLQCEQFRSRFDNGGCPPRESERALCQRAQEYIRANSRHPDAAPKAGLDLPQSCRLGQVQRNLSESQLLLKFVILGDRILLFFISANQAGYEFLPVGRSQTVAMIQNLCEPLEDFAAGKVDYLRIHFDMELAHRLFNILLKKVAGRFPHADEFLIIPDEDLYRLPFEALVTGFKDDFQQNDDLFSEYRAVDYLIQSYKVSYFFSFSDFLRRFHGPREYPYTLAAFGHPLIDPPGQGSFVSLSNGMNAFADIPSTRQEVLGLEKLFNGSRRRIFLGADFNRNNFFRFAPQAKLIHLATHFFSDDTDPTRSAFLFSSSKEGSVLCDAKQILELKLQAELVILSACESSEKNLLGFRLLSGMTAAIRQAGVRDLIASLWPVDELSSQVVPLFYQEYLRGSGSAAALRNSKLALMGRTITLPEGLRLSLAHPFLWANYVLYRFCR